jgi:DNA polymerase III epsilon subunit-like protein
LPGEENKSIFIPFLVGGHDSAEDALACLDLMKMKVKDDVKKLKQLAVTEGRKKKKK